MTTQHPQSPYKPVAVVCSIIAVAASVLLVAIKPSTPNSAQPWDFRTFDRPLVPEAPGCVIRTPDGRDLNRAISEGAPGKVAIPKGTLMTVECFPLKSSEKATRKEG